MYQTIQVGLPKANYAKARLQLKTRGLLAALIKISSLLYLSQPPTSKLSILAPLSKQMW